ncbi:MAG: hypothetical protein MUD08_08740, partial [Cytophagales bacterium]|nr:hypothetical protein [Cytophagales bacterium]
TFAVLAGVVHFKKQFCYIHQAKMPNSHVHAITLFLKPRQVFLNLTGLATSLKSTGRPLILPFPTAFGRPTFVSFNRTTGNGRMRNLPTIQILYQI